ncbi:hypothetical protein F8M41_020330 [Gigaspora margarita]|uniref:Uncharacterized protein n=1 Tax=Gigaspora margarita TaxID=4874 RepID=A0A8H4AII5_GIGMA|nr:hypothetical protein F8M41_020330 [Gigaspora margarita]
MHFMCLLNKQQFFIIVVQCEDNILQLAIIGLDQINITSQLLEDIYFIPIFLTLDTISIIVSYIGDNTFNGFVSSLITKKGISKNMYLVQQQIVNNKFILDFYKGMDLEFHYKNENALDVWKKTKILAKYNGISLFGYIYSSVIQERLTKSIVACSL